MRTPRGACPPNAGKEPDTREKSDPPHDLSPSPAIVREQHEPEKAFGDHARMDTMANPTHSPTAPTVEADRPLAQSSAVRYSQTLPGRLGCMADAVVHAKTGPGGRFFTRACADEIATLLREAERAILEGR